MGCVRDPGTGAEVLAAVGKQPAAKSIAAGNLLPGRASLSRPPQIASDLLVHFSHVWFRRLISDFNLPNKGSTSNPLPPSSSLECLSDSS